MQALNEQQLQNINGGVAPGGCIRPLPGDIPFPIF